MTLPIEQVDVDQLILRAGSLDGQASIIQRETDIEVPKSGVLQILKNDIDNTLRCAAYIRYLEARLYPHEKIAAVPAAGPYSSKPPRPRPGPGADHSD